MIVVERRACAILYNLLRSRRDDRPWLIPANVCADVPATLIEAHQPFVLVDLHPQSLEMDIDACLEELDARPFGGIVYVRGYGREGDRTDAFARLKEHQADLFIVDDRCLSRPDPGGQFLSPLADASLFSTGYAKYADLGGGGFAHLAPGVPYERHFVPFDRAALAEQNLRCKRAVAESIALDKNVPGWLDLRDSAIEWSEYRRRIETHLETVDHHKRLLNATYRQLLPPEIQMPAGMQDWRFNILVNAPDRLVEDIFAAGLFASRHYSTLSGSFGSGRFPVAENLHGQVVNLFNDLNFDEERVRRTVGLVLRHLGGAE